MQENQNQSCGSGPSLQAASPLEPSSSPRTVNFWIKGNSYKFSKLDLQSLISRCQQMIDDIDAQDRLAAEQKAKTTPGTRVYWVKSDGSRHYGVVAAPAAVRMGYPNSPMADSPNVVWAYWGDTTKPTYLPIQDVKVAE